MSSQRLAPGRRGYIRGRRSGRQLRAGPRRSTGLAGCATVCGSRRHPDAAVRLTYYKYVVNEPGTGLVQSGVGVVIDESSLTL